MSQTPSEASAAIEHANALHDALLATLNEHGQRKGSHPADQLAALVCLVANVLQAYSVPPSIFIDRVVIAMGRAR